MRDMKEKPAARPRISIVVNTACGDPEVRERKNPHRQRSYAYREHLLEFEVLPRCAAFDEIVVAGQFPPGVAQRFPRAQFVEVSPRKRDRWDALLQREVGARFASGGVLVFCHDDHAPGEGFVDALAQAIPDNSWDVLVPRRVHLHTGRELNNGRMEGYMGGHCYVMRRWLWAAAPLTAAPDEYWDLWWTKTWTEMGGKIAFSDALLHYDVEALENEV